MCRLTAAFSLRLHGGGEPRHLHWRVQGYCLANSGRRRGSVQYYATAAPISIALPSPAIAFHPPCYRPAIELPSPSIDGSLSPYNPRPIETGLYGLEALGRLYREKRQNSSSSPHACLPLRSFSPDRFDTRKPGAIERRRPPHDGWRSDCSNICEQNGTCRRSVTAWEARWKQGQVNRAPQCCRQTLQHRATPADASAMTQRVTYSAIAGLSLSWSGRPDDSSAVTARLYAHGWF
jgi:hypothetical protein